MDTMDLRWFCGINGRNFHTRLGLCERKGIRGCQVCTERNKGRKMSGNPLDSTRGILSVFVLRDRVRYRQAHTETRRRKIGNCSGMHMVAEKMHLSLIHI